MMGLLPVTNGKIYLGKEDYQKLGTTTLRNQILYLEQNPYLFSGTIRENLVLGEDFSDGELQQALQQAGLGELKRDICKLDVKVCHLFCLISLFIFRTFKVLILLK